MKNCSAWENKISQWNVLTPFHGFFNRAKLYRKLYKVIPWCPNASISYIWCSKSIRKKKKNYVFPLRFSSLGPKLQVCLSCLGQGELLLWGPAKQSLSSLTRAWGEVVLAACAGCTEMLIFRALWCSLELQQDKAGFAGTPAVDISRNTHQRFSFIRFKPNFLLEELCLYLRAVHERKFQNNDFYGICQYFHFSLMWDLNYYWVLFSEERKCSLWEIWLYWASNCINTIPAPVD